MNESLSLYKWRGEEEIVPRNFLSGSDRWISHISLAVNRRLEDTDYCVKAKEPKVENYFQRVKAPKKNSTGEAIMRRADIEIKSKEKDKPTILIDVTMTSPVGAILAERRYEKAGCKATQSERRKYTDYKGEFNIDDTSRAYIFFFGAETMGAIGAEAQRLCVLLAKMAGGYIGTKITYIYQRLSVILQGLRSQHIYTILAKYCSHTGREVETLNSQSQQIE